MSFLDWSEELAAEGVELLPLDQFDFSKTCDAVVPAETSYVIDCPNGSEEDRFYYVGISD